MTSEEQAGAQRHPPKRQTRRVCSFCRWSGVERLTAGVGPAGSEQFVRCLSFTDPEVLSWLRSQLREARSFTAFTADVDDSGLALLSEPLAAL